MKKKGLFCIFSVMVCALLVVLLAPVDGLCQDQQVYKLKFAWLNMEGPWKAKRPELLSAAKAAVAKYRAFTGK